MKEVIALPEMCIVDIAACNVTDYVYVLDQDKLLLSASIVRIKRDDKHRIDVEPWISGLCFSVDHMSVSLEGNLIIISSPSVDHRKTVSIFDTNVSNMLTVVSPCGVVSPCRQMFLCSAILEV